jgi:hypothetical protein
MSISPTAKRKARSSPARILPSLPHPRPLPHQLLTPPRAITHILGPNCRGGCR